MKDPWYADGLRFTCTQCGQCCTGAPGYVWVSDAEIERLAAAKDMDAREFYLRYVVDCGDRKTLGERANYDCVMLEDGRCSVYAVRPIQCRTFPFWADNLEDHRTWKRTCRQCPGCDRGRLYTVAEIQQILSRTGQTDDATTGVAGSPGTASEKVSDTFSPEREKVSDTAVPGDPAPPAAEAAS